MLIFLHYRLTNTNTTLVTEVSDRFLVWLQQDQYSSTLSCKPSLLTTQTSLQMGLLTKNVQSAWSGTQTYGNTKSAQKAFEDALTLSALIA